MNDSARYAQLRALFDEAVDLAPPARDALLARVQREDPQLAGRLSGLLARDRNAAADRLQRNEAMARHALSGIVALAATEGTTVGAFRVAEQIGAGGMGRVYRAVRNDGQVEQQAALKLILQEALNPELLRRFSAERRMLAALDHPGICRFLDAGVLPEGTPYVLMELVEGEPILDYCDRRRLGINARLRLLREVLAAVDHAHRNLVVHRDLKSGNVLVTGEGNPKLLDFGIAKSLADADAGVTRTVDRFLTPMHAAPEQLLGRPTGVACDIYQLGLLAYQLLCGAPAFSLDGLRAGEIERLILDHPPPPMSQRSLSDETAHARGSSGGKTLARRLAGDLDAIVLRCLRKAPDDRYASVADLDADIARTLEGRPVMARGGDRLYRLGRFVARHRLALGLSTALLASLLAGSVALALQWMDATQQRNIALLERDRAQHAVTLLRDAFVAADPSRAAGADVRARQILDAARERIDALFDAQPELYAELADTLAGVELDLASDSAAAALAERGIEAATRAAIGGDTLRRLRLVRARALTSMGDYEDAAMLLAAVAADDGALLPDRAMAEAQLASRALRTDEALDFLEAALRATADRSAEDELATQVRWELASTLRWGGAHGRSIDVLEATLAWQRQTLPPDHPRIALTELRRFNVRSEAGAGEEALAAFAPTLELILAHYGEDSSLAALAQATLGAAHSRLGQLEEAITLYRRAYAGWTAALGDDHANTLRIALNLAEVLGRRGQDPDEAEALYRSALARGERRFGPAQSLVVYTRTRFARYLGSEGRWTEALALMGSEAAAHGAEAPSTVNRRQQSAVLVEILESAGCREGGLALADPDACHRAERLYERIELSLAAAATE